VPLRTAFVVLQDVWLAGTTLNTPPSRSETVIITIITVEIKKTGPWLTCKPGNKQRNLYIFYFYRSIFFCFFTNLLIILVVISFT
jgi:hypothetical protein